MSQEPFEGIPRNEIQWNPTIDYQKCTTCGKCVEFCHMKAFKTETVNGKNKTNVNPNRCVVFCRGCEDICPAEAITHPDEGETQKVIDKLKQA